MALQLPNQHDFQFSSVSVGDIIYRRDANYWSNLHAGTSGQVLTAHGAGLAPSWETAGGGDLTTAAILAPDTATRNTIQPTTDGLPCVTLLPHSSAPSSTQLEIGATGLGHNAMVDGFTANTNRRGIVLESPVNGSAQLQFQATGNAQYLFGIWPPTNGQVMGIQIGDPGDQGVYLQKDVAQTAHSFIIYDSTFSGQGLYRITASEQVVMAGLSAASNAKDQAVIDHGFLDNADATWKGRGLLKAVDSAGTREALRWEADGAAARIGFLGATAAVRQLLATGAGHTVDDVITILQTFGLCKQS